MSESHSYERKVLYQNDLFEIVSIEWNEKSISLSHNHGWSHCFVLIEEGVFENRLDLGMKAETQTLEVGQVLSTPVGARHEMHCKSKFGKTLHVYTPKIRELSDEGRFQASSIELLKQKLALKEATGIDSLRQLMSELKEESISTNSPYFMNQLFSGVSPLMLMAEELINQKKTTLATYEASPVFSAMECEVVESLCKIIGWEANSRNGVSVPGGSAANFMALHCAREKLFPEIKNGGMGAHSFKVYVSQEAHYSFKKACAVLGIGINNLELIPTDQSGRMIPEVLEKAIDEGKSKAATPLLVAATAGTTVLGAFDEILPLSKICKKHGIWLHVDGAWGGPAIFSKKLSHLISGIEHADSMTFDAHKLLGANLVSSFFLTKHSEMLLRANDVSGGDYLFHADDPALDRGKLSWQCGRNADATSFWTIWKSLGTEGIGDFIDHLIGIRDEAVAWVKTQDRLELVQEPDYLNLCVRILPPSSEINPEWSRVVRERLKEKNLAFVNFSTNSEGSFLRLILAHPYLQFKHLRQILEWSIELI